MEGTKLDLSNSDFSKTSLEGVNLRNINFTRSRFVEARLYQCDFSHSIFKGADFTNATFSNVDFTGADLEFAILSGVILFNTTGIYQFGPIDITRQTAFAVDWGDKVMFLISSFWGTEEEAISMVREKYGNNSLYEQQVRLAAKILEEARKRY